jgi:membrane-bound lytic murein transglycosylase B
MTWVILMRPLRTLKPIRLMTISAIASRATLLALLAALATPPAAAAALDTKRADVQSFVTEAARRSGLPPEEIRAALASCTVQQSILDAMNRPAERTKPWKDYRAIFITQERIDAGTAFWRDHEAQLTRVSSRTGVPPEIMAAIVGVETYFGRRTGTYRILDSLATLAFEYPPRGKFFQSELAEFFQLAREEKLDLMKVTGSYAGAMGPAQFIPSSYRKFAVDGDGDGRRDLLTNWDDVLASVANYFVANQWQTGQAVAARGTIVPPFTPKPPDNRLAPAETVGSLGRQGVRFSTDLGQAAPAGLIALDGEEGPEYWVGFQNFYVITRYNRSAMYALAVWQLGQSLAESVRGGPDGPLRSAPIPANAH